MILAGCLYDELADLNFVGASDNFAFLRMQFMHMGLWTVGLAWIDARVQVVFVCTTVMPVNALGDPMGVVNFGAPVDEVAFLKEKAGLNVFVESGTFKGRTALKMGELFQKVYTIEKSEVLFKEAQDNLQEATNVQMLKGDTREHLDPILRENDNLLFWLDAHWCGGDSFGDEDQCPLIEELGIIFGHNKSCIILIDDARLFSSPPPKPNKIEDWPSLKQIGDALPSDWDMIDNDDVLFVFPQAFSGVIKPYFQEKVTRELEAKNREKARAQAAKKSFLGKLGLAR